MADSSFNLADPCPDVDVLRDFLSGHLSDSTAESVSDHIAVCPRCETNLSAIRTREDVLGKRVRDCLVQPVPPEVDEFPAEVFGAGVLVTVTGPTPTPGPGSPSESVIRQRGIVGSYQLLAPIGQGGMGVVFRARHVTVQRSAAVKMIRFGPSAGREALARFRTEGEAIARLEHPHVVRLYDFAQHDGLPYYAMELVEGTNLAVELRRGPLEFRRAAELLRALADAVAYAHRQRVIHRDLKPSNILLAQDGTPKITDFGLAKLLDAEGAQLTLSEVVLGTPSYMAPEQAAGRTAEIGPRSDIYALGAILYETLTGRPPFLGKTKIETLRLVRESEPVHPTVLRPDVPPDLAAICLKCLEKNPDLRYPSAETLAEDLERWLKHQRPRHIPGRVSRVARVVRRRRTALLVGLLVLLSGLSLGAVGYYRSPERVRRAAEHELAQGRPAHLLPAKGRPGWSRILTDAEKTQTSLDSEGAFSVHTWGMMLMELLPDPQCERYDLTAEIKHLRGNDMGFVGLYVARSSYPGGTGDIYHFVQATYDDVAIARRPPVVSPITGKVIPPPDGYLHLTSRLASGAGISPEFDHWMGKQHGPAFKAAGDGLAPWRPLRLRVGPNGVEGEWDGERFTLAADRINKDFPATVAHLQKWRPQDPFFQQLQPVYNSRGGLGLLLARGSASFRSVTVTPRVGDE